MTDMVIAPDANGNFRLTLKEAAGGRLKSLHLWPATQLVTLCGRLGGFEKYEEMPAQSDPQDVSFLISPMLWPVWLDAINASVLDCRHAKEEGVALRALRRGLDHHLPSLSAEQRTTLEAFLCDAQTAVAAVKVDASLLEIMIRELKKKAFAAERILAKAYFITNFGESGAEKFVSKVCGGDYSLPPRFIKAVDQIKEDTPAAKKPRHESGQDEKNSAPKDLKPDEFWCRACRMRLPKKDGDTHRKSTEHLNNKKKR